MVRADSVVDSVADSAETLAALLSWQDEPECASRDAGERDAGERDASGLSGSIRTAPANPSAPSLHITQTQARRVSLLAGRKASLGSVLTRDTCVHERRFAQARDYRAVCGCAHFPCRARPTQPLCPHEQYGSEDMELRSSEPVA